MAYYPAMHGYYYFHPYHHSHIVTQQELASQWGMDPRNPYANDFFKAVYAEYKAQDNMGGQVVPAEEPTSPPEQVPLGPRATSTYKKRVWPR